MNKTLSERLSRLLLVVLALVTGMPLKADDTAPAPQHGIKEREPRTGSHIIHYVVRPYQLSFNRRYHELSPEEKSFLHGFYERIDEGDEPPFPAEGLKPIMQAMSMAQQKLLVRGDLFLVADVDAQGKVVAVKAVGSPSPEMTRFASSVLLLTPFKAAVCKGEPCTMQFPLRFNFDVSP